MRENNKGGSGVSRATGKPAGQGSTPLVSTAAPGGQNAASSEPSEVEAAGEPQPVSSDMHQAIGRQLRAVYDDVAKQPIPDRFLELMRQLDNKKRAG